MGQQPRVDVQGVRYTWGLVYKNDKCVAMYNLSREEAKAIEIQSGGNLICLPVSCRKYIPNRRGEGKVHGVGL